MDARSGFVNEAVVTAAVAVTTADWRDAVRATCQPLVDSGAWGPSYTERCVAILDEQGPYVVLAPGIALAHARPEDGVNLLGVGVAVLAEPVAFGHPTNDPVDVVIAFGSPDRDAHTETLAALAKALASGLADTLRAAATDEVATAALREALYG